VDFNNFSRKKRLFTTKGKFFFVPQFLFFWRKNPFQEPVIVLANSKPTLLGFPNIAMRLRGGAEERGCDYRVKKARIYVQLQLQDTSCSRRVLRTRPYILRIKE
jgi:hypothetical protein